MTFPRFLCMVALPLALWAADKDAHWPQWRGPGSTGVSVEKNLPVEWSGTTNVAWKTPLPGKGLSQPVIWGNRIFLTTALEGAPVDNKAPKHLLGNGREFVHPQSVGVDRAWTLKVLGLDAESGKVLWEQVVHDGPVFDARHTRNTYASPTPVTDGKAVYSFFGAEGIYAHDFKGKLLWKASVGQLATLGLAAGASPILHQNLLILQCDEDAGEKSALVALDKATGKEVWKTPRKVQIGWSTPVVVRAASRPELVTSGNERIIAYDPDSGKELWSAPGHRNNAIPTPVSGDGMVFVSAGYPQKKTLAIKLGGSGDLANTPNIAWTYDKGTAYVPSTLYYDGLLYLLSDKGLLTCLDPKTGEVKYDNGRVPKPASFMASPVAYDGKLLLISEDGDAFLVKAGPVHEIVQTNSLGEQVLASPAIANGAIYIRGAENLYCIRSKKAGSKL